MQKSLVSTTDKVTQEKKKKTKPNQTKQTTIIIIKKSPPSSWYLQPFFGIMQPSQGASACKGRPDKVSFQSSYRRKGCDDLSHPVVFAGRIWRDVHGGLAFFSVLVCLVSFSCVFLAQPVCDFCVPVPSYSFFLFFFVLEVGCTCLAGLCSIASAMRFVLTAWDGW